MKSEPIKYRTELKKRKADLEKRIPELEKTLQENRTLCNVWFDGYKRLNALRLDLATVKSRLYYLDKPRQSEIESYNINELKNNKN